MHDQARKTTPIDNLVSLRTVLQRDKMYQKTRENYVAIVRGKKTVDWLCLNQQIVYLLLQSFLYN